MSRLQFVQIQRDDVYVLIDTKLDVTLRVDDEEMKLNLYQAYELIKLISAATSALERMTD